MSHDTYKGILFKSKRLAIRSVSLFQHLREDGKNDELASAFLKESTGIGLEVRLASAAKSHDKASCHLDAALVHAQSTIYWLEILLETGYFAENEYGSIYNNCIEIENLLTQHISSQWE